MISNQLLKYYPVFSSANCPVRTLRLTVKCPVNTEENVKFLGTRSLVYVSDKQRMTVACSGKLYKK